MKYKMLVCDYDGTLKPFEKAKVPLKTRRAIARFKKAGGIFVICTGREYKSIKQHLAHLHYQGDLLCLQGSVCIRDERELFTTTLDHETTLLILKTAEEDGLVPQLYDTKDYYTAFKNPQTDDYGVYTQTTPLYLNQKLSDYAKEKNFCANKILIHCPEEESLPYTIKLQNLCGEKVEAMQSGPTFSEVASSKAGKGNGVKTLAEHYGISLEEVVCVGDATNDLSMLKVAGLGVAMENAMPQLKEVADYICPTVNKCGVAHLINLILKDKI